MTEHKTWCPAYRHRLNSETTVSNAGYATVGKYKAKARNGQARLMKRSSECGCGASGQYVKLRRAFEKARTRAEET